jgi:hypothetical protein
MAPQKQTSFAVEGFTPGYPAALPFKLGIDLPFFRFAACYCSSNYNEEETSMNEPSRSKEQDGIDDEDYLDDDDEWATDFDDHDEAQDDFDVGAYAGAWR